MTDNLGDRWSRQVRDWLDSAAQKTEEVARVSRRQVELLQVEWDLIRRRADLGERLMRRIEQGEFPEWSSDPVFVEMVETVRTLERRQREKKAEIQDIRGAGP